MHPYTEQFTMIYSGRNGNNTVHLKCVSESTKIIDDKHMKVQLKNDEPSQTHHVFRPDVKELKFITTSLATSSASNSIQFDLASQPPLVVFAHKHTHACAEAI